MVKKAASDAKPAKKARSTGGGRTKGKLTPYNKFMKDELARLKNVEPNLKHPDRFRIAAQNWSSSKENPKNST